MPEDAKDVKLMRVTIREDFSIGMADMVRAQGSSGGHRVEGGLSASCQQQPRLLVGAAV